MNLSKIKAEAEEIEAFLSQPDSYAKPDFAAKAKRANILKEILALDEKIKKDKTIENIEITVVRSKKNSMSFNYFFLLLLTIRDFCGIIIVEVSDII